ncbi:MAG: TRAP transporter substrate-binding protein DctP [Deltaproteobacteria bacterium]|nr:TRAP transporter substrate-binding protein DctP [Deltaproteobacteria bacterium]
MFEKKNKLFAIIVAVSLLTVLISFQDSNAASQGKDVIKIRMVGTLPVGHHLTDALNLYKKYVEEKSQGRVIVEIFPAQQLYNDKDLVSVLPRGAVDMAIANLDMWAGLNPSVSFLTMPLIFDSEDHFYAVAHGEAGDIINGEFLKVNCKTLGWIQYGTADIISKEPYATLEDFKGKRVRAYGQMCQYFLEALGMAPTMMSSSEMYQALQKGTIDLAMSGLTSFVSRKLYEVAKYVPDVTLSYNAGAFGTVANLDFYNNLPKDIQKILDDGALEIENFTRERAKEATVKSRQILLDNGVTFLKISDEQLANWKARTLPVMKARLKENYDSDKVDIMFDALEKHK